MDMGLHEDIGYKTKLTGLEALTEISDNSCHVDIFILKVA